MRRSIVIVLLIAALSAVHALAGLLFKLCDGLSGNLFPHLTQSDTANNAPIHTSDPAAALGAFIHSNWVFLLPVAGLVFLLLLHYLVNILRQELEKKNPLKHSHASK